MVAFILVLQFGITFPCPSQQCVFLACLAYELITFPKLITAVFKSSWNLTKLFAFLGHHVSSRVQDPKCNLATYQYY
jgi:hypothetical protein